MAISVGIQSGHVPSHFSLLPHGCVEQWNDSEAEKGTLGQLPTDIISHVLGFLSLSEALKTSPVSHGWKEAVHFRCLTVRAFRLLLSTNIDVEDENWGRRATPPWRLIGLHAAIRLPWVHPDYFPPNLGEAFETLVVRGNVLGVVDRVASWCPNITALHIHGENVLGAGVESVEVMSAISRLPLTALSMQLGEGSREWEGLKRHAQDFASLEFLEVNYRGGWTLSEVLHSFPSLRHLAVLGADDFSFGPHCMSESRNGNSAKLQSLAVVPLTSLPNGRATIGLLGDLVALGLSQSLKRLELLGISFSENDVQFLRRHFPNVRQISMSLHESSLESLQQEGLLDFERVKLEVERYVVPPQPLRLRLPNLESLTLIGSLKPGDEIRADAVALPDNKFVLRPNFKGVECRTLLLFVHGAEDEHCHARAFEEITTLENLVLYCIHRDFNLPLLVSVRLVEFAKLHPKRKFRVLMEARSLRRSAVRHYAAFLLTQLKPPSNLDIVVF